MKKKEGKSFTLYLPADVMARAKLIADERDKSTSQVVTAALREYLKKEAAEQGASTPRPA